MQIRLDFIRNIFQRMGRSSYTADEWQQWLSDRELSEKHIQAGLALWQAGFEEEDMHPATKKEVIQLQQHNTRWSMKQARNKVRSAFNAHLEQLYGHSQMAKFFLKYPPAPAVQDTSRLTSSTNGANSSAASTS